MKELYLDRAKQILSSLSDIQSYENYHDELYILTRKINLYRKTVPVLAQNFSLLPGLTECAAITFLGVGLCRELTQRFALDYALQFNESHIHLVFTANLDDQDENHCFILLGNLEANPRLLYTAENPSGSLQPIRKFLNDQSTHSVLVDPLLNLAIPTSNYRESPLQAYFTEHKISHVIGVKSYAINPLHLHAHEVKNQVNEVVVLAQWATESQMHELTQMTPPDSFFARDPKQELLNKFNKYLKFNKIEGKSLITSLDNNSYGAALRKVSAIGDKFLVSILLGYLSKQNLLSTFINESSPSTGENALDLIEQRKAGEWSEVVELLKNHGAVFNKVTPAATLTS